MFSSGQRTHLQLVTLPVVHPEPPRKIPGPVASHDQRDLARGDSRQTELAVRPSTDDDRILMRELSTTRRDEGLLIAHGRTGAALVTAAMALPVRGGLQCRRARLGLAQRLLGAC